MFDSNQVFGGGLHIGNQVERTSAFNPAATFITGGHASMASTLVSQNSLFTGNAAITDRPEMSMHPFVPILGHNVGSNNSVLIYIVSPFMAFISLICTCLKVM